MKKAVVLLLTAIFIFTIIFAIGGIIVTDYAVQDKIESLRQNDDSITVAKFDYSQIKGLPLVVQKYFRLNIERGVFEARYIKFKQTSEIRSDENAQWKELNAEQFYSVIEPGYVWNASFQMSELLWLRNIETYVKGKSKIIFKLFSSVNMGEHFGQELDQSSLARFLTEAVFFPSRLLPSKHLFWSGINSQKAKVTLKYYDLSVSATCYFNTLGEIIKIETDDRYKTTKSGIKKAKYIVHYSKYKSFVGYSVPTASEAEWDEDGKTFKFIKSTFTDITYNSLTPFEDGTKSF